ncbi:MAG: 50S ribosomal protein L15 [Candidatus Omnitrophota bacterium]|jgi:large subunit ribosomal protein L15
MVVKLQNIGKPAGMRSSRKRKGRGIGSGRGKTSGRGHKGAKARSGGGTYTPGFEGGQMPLVRRVPKRGFTNIFKKKWNIVNIGDLEADKAIKAGTVIDVDLLVNSKILKNRRLPLKVLGKGKLSKSLTVKASAFSNAAKKAITEAGGKAELVKRR